MASKTSRTGKFFGGLGVFLVVTTAASYIPPPLLQQLKPGGRMVIPIGPPLGQQRLMVVDRDPDGRVRTRQVMPVRFVSLNYSATFRMTRVTPPLTLIVARH